MLNVAALKPTTLKSSLSAAATSVILASLVDRHGNTVSMSTFGEWGTIVIKSGDQWECIKFDALANNSDGSVTLTVATNGRKILPVTPYTGGSTGFDFIAGSDVIVTNDALIMSTFGNVENAQTWNELQTFAVVPQTTGGNPLSANDLTRKAYVDSVVLGTLTTINVIVPGTAGATIADGDLIYYDDASNTWKLADADLPATVNNVLLGIAQGAGTLSNPISGGVLLQGVDDAQTGLTEGQTYYASNTAGDFSSTPGTTEVTVGIGKSATQIYFAPRFDQTITEAMQDLLDAQIAGTDFYGASVVGTDSYAITPTPPITAYATGMHFRFKADVANTGAATLAVSGLSAITIKKSHDQDLVTGDIEVGQIVDVVYDGTNFQMQSQTASPPVTVEIQTFTSSGTYTKPTGALFVEVYIFGAGGGGGSGRRGATNGSGGAGGGGGSFAYKRLLASALGATETVTVGTGGPGGTAKSGSDADGNAGTAGGDSSFGTSTLVKAPGGSAGAGGTTSGAAGGAGGVAGNGDITQAGGNGGNGKGAVSGAISAGTDTANNISPRGGGGAYDSEAVATNSGAAGGAFITNFVLAGGTGSIGAGGAGQSPTTGLLIGGTGGAGGGETTQRQTNGFAGGAGGSPGGGGGGGSGDTGGTSGAGGAGANGMVIIVTYF